MANLIGQTLNNRYQVLESLGRGGMADVYKIWDEERSAYLAMKVLRQDLAQDPIFYRRFEREAKALAKLQHPHIVRFYGLERDDLLAYFLMDYVEGVSLQAEILRSNGKPMPMERIGKIINAVTSALKYAHRQGLVHCDIKPGNILINKNDEIFLTDFGIARGIDSATSTMVGIGTPAYMAPELIKGEDPTPQTDIYALGIVLYEMLTGGERPFTGERATITGTTAEKVRWEHLNEKPKDIRVHNKNISVIQHDFIDRCLDKIPAWRFENVAEFSDVAHKAFHFDQVIEKREITGNSLPISKKIEKADNKVVSINKKKNILIPIFIIIAILIALFLKLMVPTPKVESEKSDEEKDIAILATEEIEFDLSPINEANANNLAIYKKIGNGVVFDVIYSLDGKTVFVGSQGGAYALDALTLEINSQFQVEGLGGIGSSLDISPDGEEIVFSLDNGTIFRLDADNLSEIEKFAIPNTKVFKIKYSNLSNRIALSTADFRVVYYDLTTRDNIFEFTGFGDIVGDLDFSNDDSMLATSSYDGNVIVWDLGTGQQIKTFYDLQYGAVAAKFSPDNSMLAMAENLGRAYIYDTNSWELLSEFETEHQGSVTDMEFSHNNEQLVTCSIREDVRVWDIKTGRRILLNELHESYVYSVSYSPDDRIIASGSLDGTVRVWDAETGEQRRERSGFMEFSDFIYFPPGMNKVYTSFGDGNIGVWDINTFKNELRLDYPRFFMNTVGFSPDGTSIAFDVGEYILVGDMREDFIYSGTEGIDTAIYAIDFSPDQKLVAVGGYDQIIRIIDIETESIIKEFSVWDESIEYIFFSSDGEQLLIGYSSVIYQVDWINFESDPNLRMLEFDGQITDAHRCLDSTKIIMSFSDGSVGEYDFDSSTFDYFDLPLEGHLFDIDLNSDETILAIVREGGIIQFWDLRNNQLIGDIRLNNGDSFEIDDIGFSNDNQFFLVVGSDAIVRIYAPAN